MILSLFYKGEPSISRLVYCKITNSKIMQEEHYELLYMLPMKFAGDEQDKIMERVSKIVKDQGGSITKNEIWGKQKLAYPIKHIHQGVYVIIEFDGERSVVSKINHILKLTPEVLRHIIVKKKKLTQQEIEAEEKRKERIVKGEKREKEKEIQKQVEEVKEEKAPAKVEKEKKEKKEKLSLEDLDKKLDEILKDDIGGV